MTLYERMAKSDRGARHLASARLRFEILRKLNLALDASGLTQSALAAALKVRKSAVNQTLRGDGNLRIKTLSDYLHALGYELEVRLVEAGEPRRAALEDRDVRPAPVELSGAKQAAEAANRADSAQVESIHVLRGTESGQDLLVEMAIQPVGSRRPEYTFEGRIHVVDKEPLPDGFRPLERPEVV
ncbi:XRE family transcriptional regulator [Streptomyces sp. NPDC048376]|uniref:helix-turn-helix domain-containing protein n=1 Tax=unclassified Streptomyces TaxID=2593676 RepID=UPI00342094A3